jgi:hypothetical protein
MFTMRELPLPPPTAVTVIDPLPVLLVAGAVLPTVAPKI